MKKIAVLTCDVLAGEARHFAAAHPNILRLEVLEQGLHSTPDLLRLRLQQAVDRLEEDPQIDAIALGYGLCSRGVEGVSARRCTLVIPRAHDCITLLLGSRHRYAQYVAEHPGTFWYSPGWNRCCCMPGRESLERARAKYAELYGEEDADYLMELEQGWLTAYSLAAYVHLGTGDEAQTAADIERTKEAAAFLGWSHDVQRGDARLLADLISGHWDDERFLVLPPGQTATFSVAVGEVMRAVPCSECPVRPELDARANASLLPMATMFSASQAQSIDLRARA